MAVLFAGTSLADFIFSGSPTAHTTTANLAPYVTEGVRLSGASTSYIQTPSVAPQTDVWISFTIHPFDVAADYNLFTFRNSENNPVFRMAPTFAGTHGWYVRIYTSPSSHTFLTSGPALLAEGSVYRVDIHIVIDDTAGLFEMYVDGSLHLSYSGDTNRIPVANISSMAMNMINSNADQDISAVIIADTDTRGMTFVQRKPTGAGATSDWTGAAADIDEAGFNDTDKISSTTAGQVSTFTVASLPSTLSGYNPAAVVLAMRAQAGSASVLRGVVRVGSTNFVSPNVGAPAAFGPAQAIFNQNPSTLSPWTFAEVDGMEVGVKLD